MSKKKDPGFMWIKVKNLILMEASMRKKGNENIIVARDFNTKAVD